MLLHNYPDYLKKSCRVAVATPGNNISYARLNNIANKIAIKLLEEGAKPNQSIGIVMDKGCEQVIAALSILKSGAAYVPIRTTESPKRMEYLIKTANIHIVLTQHKYLSIKWPKGLKIVHVNDKEDGVLDDFFIQQSSDNLAYIVFTSGSTGAPKGVMIEHFGSSNTILDINKRFNVNENDSLLALTDITFDLSVYDIFGMLKAGGTIVYPDFKLVKEVSHWIDLIIGRQITIWNSVPAMMEMLVSWVLYKKDEELNNKLKNTLRLILLSGDWIPPDLPRKIRLIFSEVEIVSLGGATEASIWSILYVINEVGNTWLSIPYGKAMKNQNFYILDEKLNFVEDTAIGQLYISGAGIARGYLKDIGQTRKSFISHPLLGRLYKTGDLGRYLFDGNIEFIGRDDLQIKANGYRIELKGIEKSILDTALCERAVVIVDGDNNHKKIIAYIMWKPEIVFALHKRKKAIDFDMNAWEVIHEQAPNIIHDNQDPHLNTRGWINSYNKAPFSQCEMQEWVNNTIEQILNLNPRKLFEFGCGTGLLAFRLIDKVDCYHATDFSKAAVSYISDILKGNDKEKVKLYNESIEDILPDIKEDYYDTFILNSVVQYFHEIYTLEEIIYKLSKKLKSGGYIFVGDVRSLLHLRLFNASVDAHNDDYHKSYFDIFEYGRENEPELIIDHRFFYKIKEKNPLISHVDIRLKSGKFSNELNTFRYDVLLYIKHDTLTRFEPSYCDDDIVQSDNIINSVESALLKEPSCLAIKDVKNRHIKQILQESANMNMEIFQQYPKEITLADTTYCKPYDFYQLAKKLGYKSLITWPASNKNFTFDVIFYKGGVGKLPDISSLQNNVMDTHSLSNLPNKQLVTKKLTDTLYKKLADKLPEYMLPNSFYTIDKLPINVNGKISRHVLDYINVIKHNSILVKPKSKTQKIIYKICSNLFRVEKFGIYDDFTFLGGHSVLLTQLLAIINQRFKLNFNLNKITKLNNICLLSKEVDKQITG